ncbi:hypothetical protein [Alteraurantiacibacter aquimixticola]|uniref:Uncharacterized protein n=1 Tax=Alteraurantiacibacter aquimixticola TaxID=2489173 RepID=A0A4T3F070_9SPHN|nr:hypothetical protein [Alteraurantiacibacter aquimixticola]TIX49834.1 hypothetical protein E5222_13595 [Alteraurantiacibacter aquimixticola]
MRLLAPSLFLGTALAVGHVTPALAEMDPRARLVRCGEESCLRISGFREDPAFTVSVNGRKFTVEGKNSWRVRLPVDTVREISSPQARTIEISLRNPHTNTETSASTPLPIGLLGGITTLTSLEVTGS